MDPLHDHGDRQVPAGDPRPRGQRARPDARVAARGAAGRRPGRLPRPGAGASPRWPPGTGRRPAGAWSSTAPPRRSGCVAQALRPRLAACVHPSFTAPEAALRAAGVPVHRVLRDPAHDFALDPAAVPEEADLVVLGRPDNPTGRLDPVEAVAALARPGAGARRRRGVRRLPPRRRRGCTAPGSRGCCASAASPSSGASRGCASATCSARRRWSRGSTRSGSRGRSARPRSGPPRSSPAPRTSGGSGRSGVADDRAALLEALAPLPLTVWPSPANFLLLRSRARTCAPGCSSTAWPSAAASTFPGLDDHHVRVAVHPDPDVRAALVSALGGCCPAGDADVRPAGDGPARRSPDPRARRRPLGQVAARAAAAGRPRRRPVRRAGAGPRRQRRRLGGPGRRPPAGPARHLDHPRDHRRRRRPSSRRTGRCWSTASPPGSRRRWRTAGAWESADGDTALAAARSTTRSTGWCGPGGRCGCRSSRSATRSAPAWSRAPGPACCSGTRWAGSTGGSPTRARTCAWWSPGAYNDWKETRE